MNIAMVSEHASPLAAVGGVDSGGQNVHVAALAGAMADRGHDVTVYTRADAPGLPRRVEMRPGVVVEHVPAGPPSEVPKDELLPFIPDFGHYLAERWATEPPDLVHAHFWMSGLASLAGVRGRPIPVVQTFHALGSVKRRHQRERDTSPPGRIRLEKALGRQVDRIIATCTDEVRELIRVGVDRRRATVVPSGVDVHAFRPDGNRVERGRRPRLLSVGRLVERKGIDDVIKALGRVRDAELLIVGGSDASQLELDPHVRLLQQVAEKAKVTDRVRFLGQVAREQMPGLLRSSDLVVCVPWYEPFGIVPLEAMACGVPVVASAVGGMLDTVVDGVTGVHVPPCNPRQLARVVQSLLRDPLRCASYGIAGADRARARYSWERIAESTEAVYAEVVRTRALTSRGATG